MTRLRRNRGRTGHRIAVVEDYLPLLRNTLRVLEADGHEVRGAPTCEEGVELVRTFRPELLLLDYHLDAGHTARDVLDALRGHDPLLQVLLVTGYAEDLSPLQLMQELEIWGYHDKAAGPEELRIKVAAALRHRAALERLQRGRAALAKVLEVTASLGREEAPGAMLERVAAAIGDLLEVPDVIVGLANRGMFLQAEAGMEFRLLAGHGSWEGVASLAALPPAARNALLAGLKLSHPASLDGGHVVIPLQGRDGSRGCVLAGGGRLDAEVAEPLEFLARHAVVALEKAHLLRRATVDGVTGLPNLVEGRRRLEQLLQMGQRRATPTALLDVRIPGLDELAARSRAASADVVLHAFARAIDGACRATDVVARATGYRFLVGLPDAHVEEGVVVARNVLDALERRALELGAATTDAAIGVAASEPGAEEVDALLERASELATRAVDDPATRIVAEAPGERVQVS